MPLNEVLITGGAGFLAAELAQRFATEGTSVCLLDTAEPPGWADRAGFKYFRADIRDLSAVSAAAGRVDAVVHTAFAPPYLSADVIRAVNVDGTRNVCAAALARGKARVIMISSTIVLKPQRVHPFLQKSHLNRLDRYRESRAEAENILADYKATGLSCAVVRPKTFLGPGRLSAFAIIFERIRHGTSIPVLGSGRNRYQLLDIRDMAEAICLLTRSDTEGVFNLGAQDYRTIREDLQVLLDHARTGARLQFVPGSIARALLRGMELANVPLLSEWHYMSARGEDSTVDISRAQRELGWQPKFSNAQALKDTYDWYIASLATYGTAKTAHPVPFAHQVLKKLSSLIQ